MYYRMFNNIPGLGASSTLIFVTSKSVSIFGQMSLRQGGAKSPPVRSLLTSVDQKQDLREQKVLLPSM
jgi:hypothetical protein